MKKINILFAIVFTFLISSTAFAQTKFVQTLKSYNGKTADEAKLFKNDELVEMIKDVTGNQFGKLKKNMEYTKPITVEDNVMTIEGYAKGAKGKEEGVVVLNLEDMSCYAAILTNGDKIYTFDESTAGNMADSERSTKKVESIFGDKKKGKEDNAVSKIDGSGNFVWGGKTKSEAPKSFGSWIESR